MNVTTDQTDDTFKYYIINRNGRFVIIKKAIKITESHHIAIDTKCFPLNNLIIGK